MKRAGFKRSPFVSVIIMAQDDPDPILTQLSSYYGPFERDGNANLETSPYRGRIKPRDGNISFEAVLTRINHTKGITKKFDAWRLKAAGLITNGEAGEKAYVIELNANFIRVFIAHKQ